MQATIEVQAMELASLASLEAEIEAGHESIRQGGARIQRAIAGIKEQALWAEATDKGGKQIYGSFEHYCQVRWGIQKTEAYDRAMAGNIANQMISAGVPETLIPDGTKTLNALADVPVSERRAVLEAAQASGEVISTAIRRIATPEVGHIYAVTEPSSAKDCKTIIKIPEHSKTLTPSQTILNNLSASAVAVAKYPIGKLKCVTRPRAITANT